MGLHYFPKMRPSSRAELKICTSGSTLSRVQHQLFGSMIGSCTNIEATKTSAGYLRYLDIIHVGKNVYLRNQRVPSPLLSGAT